ncbi:MAG: peptidase U32 family protein, partial [Bacillota bacterium]
MKRNYKPELVAPAGNLEKLKAAVDFGADAVYLGGYEFSLRAMAGNFSLPEIKEGLRIAHLAGRRVYVTVNVFAHNHDIDRLPVYLKELSKLGVDGLIISDPGVLLLAQEFSPDLPVTISTQANVTNFKSAEFYRRQGASRLVLARELSIEEIARIKQSVPIELEVFIHGAMCLSYSGRCWLSQAMTGRSANLGECAHPCRYRYALVEEKRPGQYFPVAEDERGSYVMNSKDLCMISLIPQLIEAGVDAFKIEGRMKSPYYVAAVVKVYREAIDSILEGNPPEMERWTRELERVATRPFTTGFALGKPEVAQDIEKTESTRRVLFCGVVRDRDDKNGRLLIEQRAPFGVGDHLEYLEAYKPLQTERVTRLYDSELNPIEIARHPQQLVWLDSR